MCKSLNSLPESITSPGTQTPLAPALSTTSPETTDSSNLDAPYTLPHSGVTTLLDKDKHQQPQSNGGSLSSRSPDGGTPCGEHLLVRFLLSVTGVLRFRIVNALVVFVPVGITLHMAHMPSDIILAMNIIAILLLGQLSVFTQERAATDLGGTGRASLNAAFESAVELIILLIVLDAKDIHLAQSSTTEWLLIQLFSLLGICSTPGGLRFGAQMHGRMATHMNAYFIGLSVVANFLLPAVFHVSLTSKEIADHRAAQVSRGASVILLIFYFTGLITLIDDASAILESIHRDAVSTSTAREIGPSDSAGSTLETSLGSYMRSEDIRYLAYCEGQRQRRARIQRRGQGLRQRVR
ncbi:hypothetical protein F5144DRAFT_45563 [Chaetomium tenue]|uniref:Uncharacterized protein n=1 Tax=Chaetomium tenue TaxID=1854479 RepID=A0ACB7PQB8_9PEZI|nr:hypothetical protein F5144DRAFT_45563 [Chaetomium globosum]